MSWMNRDVIDVACLCAAWCRVCEEYAPLLEAVIAERLAQGAALRRHWVDIEDEDELVGDFDVETFPTLVVIGPDGVVRFAGPLTPQADTLRRLLRATVEARADAHWPAVAPEIQSFAARLRARFGAG